MCFTRSMKISNFSNNLSFGKTLAASCSVRTNTGDVEQCNIYELDKKDDKDYFLKLKNNPSWEDNKYLDIVNSLMFSTYISLNIKSYAMENSDGDCLGYVRAISDGREHEKKSITYIETCPEYSSNNKKRELKYIGQSLMAFIVGLAKKEDKDSVCIPSVAKGASKFYQKKCFFKKDKTSTNGLVLNNKYYDKFLKKHKKNTQSEIKFYI